MKYSIRNNFAIFLLLAGLSYQVYSQDIDARDIENSEVNETKETLPTEQFEPLLQGILAQAKKLGSVLQSLADQISNNQVKKLKDKSAMLQHIMQIKEQINAVEMQAGALVDQDINQISMLLTIISFFEKHIETLVHNQLGSIPELDTSALIKRSMDTKANIESVAKMYQDNEKLLNKLETNVNYIGLTAFNRAFRWLENINDNYNITSKVFKTAACSLAASVMLIILNKDLLSHIPGYEKFIKPLKERTTEVTAFDENSKPIKNEQGKQITRSVIVRPNALGDRPHFNNDGVLTNPEDLSILGKIIANGGPQGLNLILCTFTPIITWGLFGNFIAKDAKKAKIWAEDTWIKLLNWLRGGASRKAMRGGKKEPSVTFKDGIGSEHVNYVLHPYVEYFCRTEGWDRANIAPQTGIIFAGESRTGKTFMAERLAGQIKQEMRARGLSQELTFIVFNAAEVLMIGISNILEYARSQAPCIIFIDEIDMLNLQRETNAQVLSEFLTQMSGCMEKDVNKRVIVIGATNKPESLDKALLQYGRFGKVIWFELPTMQERMLFLARECASRAILIDPAFLEKIARETERCSYDALHNIIATAAQKAKIEGSAVKQHHIEIAFDEEIRQVLVKDIQLPEHQQHLIALHLAGHTLATQLLNGQKQVSKVTIRPVKLRIQEEPLWARFEKKKEKIDPIVYGKVFTFSKDQEFSMPTGDDMIKECKIMLAGHAAEKIALGQESGCGYHRDDYKEALSIAKYIVFKGMDPSELPKSVRQDLEEKAYELMNKYEQEVTELLTQKKENLLIIAEMLEKQQTLTGKEVNVLVHLKNDEINGLREEIKKIEAQLLAEIQAAQGKVPAQNTSIDTAAA